MMMERSGDSEEARSGADRADFLLEIGCEEIPARMIGRAAVDLAERLMGVLDSAGVISLTGAQAPVRSFAAPRRIAALVNGVLLKQADHEEEVTGPPVSAAFGAGGRPTQAAAAFARKMGVAVSELMRVNTVRGEYVAVRRLVTGRSTSDIIAEGLPRAIAGMTFPKMMRWGDGSRRFVRPVHWVVAMLGDQVVPLELFGAASGRRSAGHRVLGERWIAIASARDYERALLAQGIVAGREERRQALRGKMAELSEAAGVRCVEDEELMAEVADLVEHPGAVLGSFSGEFLELPREILVTTLRHHQKSFATETDRGLSNHFLSVADRDGDPEGHVRQGNEWVIAGRLEDARFFLREDQKVPFASRREKLKQITFHAKAGSYFEKSERIETLALSLAGRLEADGSVRLDRQALAEAARLCKCDLTTGLVGEFPELQGVAGGIYIERESLREGGQEAAVSLAAAVRDHYRPVGARDSLPATPEGKLLALADRLDTLTVLSRSIGLPKGSKDPFALRRAALAAVRIVAEAPLGLRLWEDLVLLPSRVSGQTGGGAPAVSESELLVFLLDRFQFWLKETKGVRYDTVNAVMLASGGHRAASEMLPRVAEKVLALERLRELPEIAVLIEMHKRCRNIDEQARSIGEEAKLDTPLKDNPAEPQSYQALVRGLDEVRGEVGCLMERDEFEEALQKLARLRPALSSFFEHVLVIHPEPSVRRQRLELVRQTASLIEEVADLKQISISRQEIQERLAQLAGQAAS